MIKESEQPNAKARQLIGKETSKYLKSRMKYSQDIQNSMNISTITFTEYLEGMKKLKKEKELIEYKKMNIGRIRFTPKEINELANLVEESLSKYTLTTVEYIAPFTHLISDALENYKKNIRNEKEKSMREEKIELDKKEALIDKWLTVESSKNSFGIDERIEGRISWGYSYGSNGFFMIRNSEGNTVVSISSDGMKKKIEKKEEDILIAQNMYLGELHLPNIKKPIFVVLLKKGKDKMKAISYDGKTYPTEYNENGFVETVSGMNNFFSTKEISYLTEDLYTNFTLDRIINVYNKIGQLTEEEKEQIEKTIGYAVDWWAEAVEKPTFNNGDMFTSLFATLLNEETKKPEEEKMELFKEYLADEIRAGLILNPNYFTISVDYNPDIHLYNASEKAGLNNGILSFPWKTTMYINKNRVSVRAGYGADEEVIYDADQSDIEDSKKPKEKK